jgi:hypothetical protein
VTVRRSKTDQEGEGQTVGIPFGSAPDVWPVKAVKDWIVMVEVAPPAASRLRNPLSADRRTPLFREVTRRGAVGAALSDRSAALVVQRAVGSSPAIGAVLGWAPPAMRATVAEGWKPVSSSSIGLAEFVANQGLQCFHGLVRVIPRCFDYNECALSRLQAHHLQDTLAIRFLSRMGERKAGTKSLSDSYECARWAAVQSLSVLEDHEGFGLCDHRPTILGAQDHDLVPPARDSAEHIRCTSSSARLSA